jgi:hypothetical protein
VEEGGIGCEIVNPPYQQPVPGGVLSKALEHRLEARKAEVGSPRRGLLFCLGSWSEAARVEKWVGFERVGPT